MCQGERYSEPGSSSSPDEIQLHPVVPSTFPTKSAASVSFTQVAQMEKDVTDDESMQQEHEEREGRFRRRRVTTAVVIMVISATAFAVMVGLGLDFQYPAVLVVWIGIMGSLVSIGNFYADSCRRTPMMADYYARTLSYLVNPVVISMTAGLTVAVSTAINQYGSYCKGHL